VQNPNTTAFNGLFNTASSVADLQSHHLLNGENALQAQINQAAQNGLGGLMYHAQFNGYNQALGGGDSTKQGAIKSMTPSPLLKPIQPTIFYDNSLVQPQKSMLSGTQMQSLQ